MDQLVQLSYPDARSLEVQVDDLHFTMEMDAQAGTCSLNGQDLSGMSENVRTLHKNLYDTVGNLSWDELRLDAELPALAETAPADAPEEAETAAAEASEAETDAVSAKDSGEAAPEEADAAPQGSRSACRFVFTDAEGNVTDLVLYPTEDENIYLAAINGQNTHMTVRRRSLTGNTGVLNFYEKLTDAIEAE